MNQAKNKGEQAIAYHKQGYNCAQAVIMAFAPEMGVTEGQASRMGQALGGGVGQMREVCGAITGAAVVLGMLRGMERAPTPEEKKAFYQRMRDLGEAFEAKHETSLCMRLLGLKTRDDPMPAPEDRPCDQLIYDMAMMLKDDVDADNPNT